MEAVIPLETNLDRAAALLSLLPAETLRRHQVVPLAVERGMLVLGVAESPDPNLLRDLAFLTGKTVTTVEVDPEGLRSFLETALPGLPEPLDLDEISEVSGEVEVAETFVPTQVRVSSQGSTVQQVDRLIHQAIEVQASDIHFEPYETFFRVRYRLDGVLHTVCELSLLQRDAVISRLKIMASLDIAEKRRPQDGRIRFRFGERSIDLRVIFTRSRGFLVSR